jgi:hypothetical protein
MMRRVEACIESHGGHFEHLLWIYSFSYKSQIECFRTHVDMDMFSCSGLRSSCSDLSTHLSYTLFLFLFISLHFFARFLFICFLSFLSSLSFRFRFSVFFCLLSFPYLFLSLLSIFSNSVFLVFYFTLFLVLPFYFFPFTFLSFFFYLFSLDSVSFIFPFYLSFIFFPLANTSF